MSAGPSRRSDGRRPSELRPLTVSIGELDRADGSGRFGFGSTAALASCNGPIEVRLREERPDRATFEVSHRPLEGVGATPSRALITTLESIYPPILSLSQHPRSLIQLVVQSLSPSSSSSHYSSAPTPYIDTDPSSSSQQQKNAWPKSAPSSSSDQAYGSGYSSSQQKDVSPSASYTFSSRAAAINASTLALLSAGSVPLKALPIAVSLANTASQDGSVLVLDPSGEEEERSKGRFGFAWAFGHNISLGPETEVGGQDQKMQVEGEAEEDRRHSEMELVWAESEGVFTKEEFSDALELSKIATKQILSAIRESLEQHLESRKL
ncbi:hypothetical protein I317_04052 [Kwoniella heveanensis CBS 569]|nr:hypothetical protein I317_04052 [Kwoniella heveanensis CBS 569]